MPCSLQAGASDSPPSINLEPMTMSTPSSERASNNLGISDGSCCPSASRVTIKSAPFLKASENRLRRAAPYPRFLPCLITVASRPSAISPVRSEDPSSHTIILSANFLVRTITAPMFRSSLRAGMQATTVPLLINDVYTPNPEGQL